MRLSIVLAINGIYTKPVIFGHRPACRLFIIGPIVAISRLSFACVYSTLCTNSVVIAYKNSYKQPLYFGIHGVRENGNSPFECRYTSRDSLNVELNSKFRSYQNVNKHSEYSFITKCRTKHQVWAQLKYCFTLKVLIKI